MAEFLTTVANSYHIEQIILKAEKNLTLVTPYLSLSKNLLDRLTDADKRNVQISLIYGKNELKNTEKKKLEALKNLEIYFCENLHAKCYFNEHSMIITSMNLYEFSERNNREMGILVEQETDEQVFIETLKEIESIKNASILETKPKEKKEDILELIYLENKHMDKTTFFYPSLYRVLQDKFDDYVVTYDDSSKICMERCPKNDPKIIIEHRIDFNFEDRYIYDFIKEDYRESISIASPKSRPFWNPPCINIYPEKRYKSMVSQKGLEVIVIEYYKTIKNTLDIIKVATEKYDNLF